MKKKVKKAKAVKRSVKKIPQSKPVSQANNSMALAMVSYNDIIQPETHKGELSLLASYFPKNVIEFITRPTPPKYIMKREGPGKREFSYVSGWYAKKCANYAFGFNHSFEIKKKEISGTSAIVEGRFIVNDPKSGRQIFFKDDIGGHQIRFLKDKAHTAENAVDIANDYKAAATDALKRCMSQIGFFMDVYGVSEAKDDGNYTNGRPDAPHPPETPQKPSTPKSAVDAKIVKPETRPNTPECWHCANPVSEAEAKFSEKAFGKRLCRNCQRLAKEGVIRIK